MSSSLPRPPGRISRRDFLKTVALGSSGLLASCVPHLDATPTTPQVRTPPVTATPAPPVVSIVKIKDSDIGGAVEEAIRLLGGIEQIASGKERIMLKPNLVSGDRRATTEPEVIRSLAALMLKAGWFRSAKAPRRRAALTW